MSSMELEVKVLNIEKEEIIDKIKKAKRTASGYFHAP